MKNSNTFVVNIPLVTFLSRVSDQGFQSSGTLWMYIKWKIVKCKLLELHIHLIIFIRDSLQVALKVYGLFTMVINMSFSS